MAGSAGPPAGIPGLLQAFAAGISVGIEEALADPDERLPYEFHELQVTPEPWTAGDAGQVWIGMMANRFNDVTAEQVNGMRYRYLVSHFGSDDGPAIFDDLFPLEVPDAPVTCPDAGATTEPPPPPTVRAVPAGIDRAAAREEARLELLTHVLTRMGLPRRLGSHMWSAGGARTDGLQGLLLGGPQMGFTVLGVLHEVGLHGAGFDLVGSTPAGFPVVLFGHNGTIARSRPTGVVTGVPPRVAGRNPRL